MAPQSYQGPLDIVIAQNINNKSYGAYSGINSMTEEAGIAPIRQRLDL